MTGLLFCAHLLDAKFPSSTSRISFFSLFPCFLTNHPLHRQQTRYRTLTLTRPQLLSSLFIQSHSAAPEPLAYASQWSLGKSQRGISAASHYHYPRLELVRQGLSKPPIRAASPVPCILKVALRDFLCRTSFIRLFGLHSSPDADARSTCACDRCCLHFICIREKGQ